MSTQLTPNERQLLDILYNACPYDGPLSQIEVALRGLDAARRLLDIKWPTFPDSPLDLVQSAIHDAIHATYVARDKLRRLL